MCKTHFNGHMYVLHLLHHFPVCNKLSLSTKQIIKKTPTITVKEAHVCVSFTQVRVWTPIRSKRHKMSLYSHVTYWLLRVLAALFKYSHRVGSQCECIVEERCVILRPVTDIWSMINHLSETQAKTFPPHKDFHVILESTQMCKWLTDVVQPIWFNK